MLIRYYPTSKPFYSFLFWVVARFSFRARKTVLKTTRSRRPYSGWQIAFTRYLILSTAPPDTAFHYSNTGYNILGKIIEIVSGTTYSDYITQKFITPLGLTHTYSVWEGSDVAMRTPYIHSHLYIEG